MMKGAKTYNKIFILAALLALAVGVSAQPAEAQTVQNCLPSCDTTDARMFVLAGSGLSTFVDDSISFEFAAYNGTTTLHIGIFDGDTSGAWDYGTSASVYRLYADPDGDGVGNLLVGEWSGAQMPNNSWFKLWITPGEEARAPSGHFFYSMVISNADPEAMSLNGFKVRSTGVTTMKPQTIPFMAPASGESAYLVYPNFPDLGATTNDGTWNFHLNVPTTTTAFQMWDGDLDFGSDTDDADTPNDSLPGWAVGETAFEGAASGDPADDTGFPPYLRTPSVYYEIVTPEGAVFQNLNPSGDLEWEQFLITTDAGTPADYQVGSLLPFGIYDVKMYGVDLNNLNAWYFPYEVICEDKYGNVCPVIYPFELGDTVWKDANGNGSQDGGEAGIANVAVNLVDSNGVTVNSTFTDSTGYFSFGVYAGDYTLEIANANFAQGGPLFEMVATVSTEMSISVVNSGDMDCDFGFMDDVSEPPPGQGVGTPAYWRDNPNAWPVDQLVIGGRTFTKTQALIVLGWIPAEDMRVPLLQELIATKLNILIGAESSCIADTVTAADAWLQAQGFDRRQPVLAGSPEWVVGQPLYMQLMNYNLGLLCAPRM